jgi:hypothetical protein
MAQKEAQRQAEKKANRAKNRGLLGAAAGAALGGVAAPALGASAMSGVQAGAGLGGGIAGGDYAAALGSLGNLQPMAPKVSPPPTGTISAPELPRLAKNPKQDIYNDPYAGLML